jgi:hypothetical protein
MRGAILLLPQYVFMAWCLVNTGTLPYLTLPYLTLPLLCTHQTAVEWFKTPDVFSEGPEFESR